MEAYQGKSGVVVSFSEEVSESDEGGVPDQVRPVLITRDGQRYVRLDHKYQTR